MKKTFTVTIKNKETGKVYQKQVNSDEYILKEFEKKGFKLVKKNTIYFKRFFNDKGVDVVNQNKLI